MTAFLSTMFQLIISARNINSKSPLIRKEHFLTPNLKFIKEDHDKYFTSRHRLALFNLFLIVTFELITLPFVSKQ